ncbi:caspase-like [Mercenaria mercenaria]|uniref:caspase-like n=1 Tax=Mercenaria mercenaria TaxID=6596 RepID=UPI00234F18E5|nr:caspase-like [Mercenaria mercenaria]
MPFKRKDEVKCESERKRAMTEKHTDEVDTGFGASGTPPDQKEIETSNPLLKHLVFSFLDAENTRDLNKSETLSLLEKAKNTDYSTCDCFLFAISTHGLEQKNATKGGLVEHALVCADDELIFTSTIIETFNDKNCPGLKGKPKIFIIQACRGKNVDPGFDISVSMDNGGSSITVKDKKDNFTPVPSDMSDTKAEQDTWITTASSLKCYVDMLVMYAIPPGMFAWRNTDEGSWMIHYLHEVLLDEYKGSKSPISFLAVLTGVSARMSRRTTNTSKPEWNEKKAVPVIEHMLTRKILFSKKI